MENEHLTCLYCLWLGGQNLRKSSESTASQGDCSS